MRHISQVFQDIKMYSILAVLLLFAGIHCQASAGSAAAVQTDGLFVSITGRAAEPDGTERKGLDSDFTEQPRYVSYYGEAGYVSEASAYGTVFAFCSSGTLGIPSNSGFVLDEALVSGTLLVSFDIRAKQTDQWMNVVYNDWFVPKQDDELAGMGFYMDHQGRMGYAPDTIWHNTGSGANTRPYEADVWYHIDALYDLDAATASYFVDGTPLGTATVNVRALLSGIQSVSFQCVAEKGLNDATAGFALDHLHVSQVSSDSFTVDNSVNGDEGYMTFWFSEPLADLASFNPGISGGGLSFVKMEWIGSQRVRLYYAGRPEAGKSYEIVFDSVASVTGNTLPRQNITLMQREISIDVYAYEEAAQGTRPTSSAVYRNQVTSALDGRYCFDFLLPASGAYLAYVSWEGLPEPQCNYLYVSDGLDTMRDDFADYQGGVPSGWSNATLGQGAYTAAQGKDGTAVKMRAEDGNAGISYVFPRGMDSGVKRLHFDVQPESGGCELIVKLLSEEITDFATQQDSVYDTFALTLQGGIGFVYGAQAKQESLGIVDSYYAVPIMKYSGGQWYHVDIWIDLDFGRLTYYINDGYCGYERTQGKLERLAGIAFTMKQRSACSVTLDNVAFGDAPYGYLRFQKEQGYQVPSYLGEDVTIDVASDVAGNVFTAGQTAFAVTMVNNGGSSNVYDAQYAVRSETGVIWESTQRLILPRGEKTVDVVTPVFDRFGTLVFSVCLTEAESGESIAHSVDFSVVNAAADGFKNQSFGINNHLGYAYGEPEKLLGLLGQAGFGLMRDSVNWIDYERVKGEYNIPSYYWDYVNYARQNNVTMLHVLAFNHPLYDKVDGTHQEAMDGYCGYIYDMVSKLAVTDSYYEIWNEADLAGLSAEAYVEVLRQGSEAVRRAGGKVVGVVASSASIDWIEAVLKTGGQYMDVVSVHQYVGGDSPEQSGFFDGNLKKIRALMDKYGLGDRALWLSEFGWYTSLVSESRQAAYGVQTNVLQQASGVVDKLLWYNSQEKSFTYLNQPYEYSYGVIRAPGYYPLPYGAKEAYLAFANYNTLLGGAQFIADESRGEISAYRFADRYGRRVSVLWSKDGERRATLPADREYALLYDLYGNCTRQYARGGSIDVLVGETPVYLVIPDTKAALFYHNQLFSSAQELKQGEIVTVGAVVDAADSSITGGTLICGAYRGDTLLDTKTMEFPLREGRAAVSMEYSLCDADELRIFLFDSMEKLSPLALAGGYELNMEVSQ